MTEPLQFSIRADLFRVAQNFTDLRAPPFAGVHCEPVEGGGVSIVGADAASLIALVDPSGEITRPATLYIGKAMTNMAVDMFRRDGVTSRLQGNSELATLDRDAHGMAARNLERDLPYFDWRAEIAKHAIVRLEPPVVIDGEIARRVSDAALGLARAAGDGAEPWIEFRGGIGATLATFPAWPDLAVAVFTRSISIDEHRRAERNTFWHCPPWANVQARAPMGVA